MMVVETGDILDHSFLRQNISQDNDTLYQPYVDRNLRFPGLDRFLGFLSALGKLTFDKIYMLVHRKPIN